MNKQDAQRRMGEVNSRVYAALLIEIGENGLLEDGSDPSEVAKMNIVQLYQRQIDRFRRTQDPAAGVALTTHVDALIGATGTAGPNIAIGAMAFAQRYEQAMSVEATLLTAMGPHLETGRSELLP